MISLNTKVILGVIILAVIALTFIGASTTVKEGFESWMGPPSCKYCSTDPAVLKKLSGDPATWPSICPTRGSYEQCEGAIGQWGPPPLHGSAVCAAEKGPGFIKDFFDSTGTRQLPVATCEAKCKATSGCKFWSTRMNDMGGCMLFSSCDSPRSDGGYGAYNTYTTVKPVPKPPPPGPNDYTCDLGWAAGAPMKCIDGGKVACASQDGAGCLWGVCNADGSINHASANASNPNWKSGGKKPLIMSCPGWKSPSGKTVCDLLKCPKPPPPEPNATCRGFKCPPPTKAKWQYTNSGPKSCANLGPGWDVAADQGLHTKVGGEGLGDSWVRGGPGGYHCAARGNDSMTQHGITKSNIGCYSSQGCDQGCPGYPDRKDITCMPPATEPTQCAGPTCTSGECCSGGPPKCSSLSSCPAGQQFKAGKNSITCATATCVSSECCEPIPHEKCSSFTCAAESSKKSGASSITCKDIKCTEDDCCSTNTPLDLPTKGAYINPCQGEKQYWEYPFDWGEVSKGKLSETECEDSCTEDGGCGTWLMDGGGNCFHGKITGSNSSVSCGKPGKGAYWGKMKCSQAKYPIINENNDTTYNKATCNATCRGFKCPTQTKAKWQYTNSGSKSCANLGPGWDVAADQGLHTKVGGEGQGDSWVLGGPGGYHCAASGNKSMTQPGITKSNIGCYSLQGCDPGCPGYPDHGSATCMPPATAPTQCAGPTCTSGECCSGQCSSFTCPGGMTAKDPNITCTTSGCDWQQCCTPNPKCSSLSSCPAGRQFKAGKNSITCAAAKCVSTECCEAIPHEKCSGFTCAQNSSKKTGVESTTCKGIMCTEDECCSANPKPNCAAQKVSCPTDYHTITNPGATECKAYKCTSQECCSANPTCASMSCPAGTTTKSSSILCKGATCVSSECCASNPKCGSFKCPSGMDRISSSALCSGSTCTTDDCCMPQATCASFGSCDPLHTDAPTSKLCEGTFCTSAECCIPHPTCGAFPCGTGYTKKSNAAGITCLEKPCGKSECCTANSTCKGFICPAGEARKLLSDEHTCKGAECTTNECCGDNPTCESHTCSSSFYQNGSLLSNADKITCGSPTCTDAECCSSSPSYKLPKVNMWPLFN